MIHLHDTKLFSEKLLSIYLAGGLGSLSKKDTESLMLWLILKHSKEFLEADGKPNYTKLTVAFKIPQRRVIDLLSHARLSIMGTGYFISKNIKNSCGNMTLVVDFLKPLWSLVIRMSMFASFALV